ncbi:MAG: DUF72 domain-containing protein [Acidobacteriota bacterium]
MEIIIGCAGFQKARKVYYEKFNFVEIQKIFYEPPSLDLMGKWREESPESFIFSIKAWQVITHPPSSPTYKKMKRLPPETCGFFRPSEQVYEAYEVTLKIAKILKSDFILFQCPKSFTPTQENKANMEKFFKKIKRSGINFGWEPRGESWKDEIILEICRKLNLIHVVDPFQRESLYGKFSYYRLHGIKSPFYRYQEKDFKFLVKKFINERNFVVFNNVASFDDALTFKEYLKKEGIYES